MRVLSTLLAIVAVAIVPLTALGGQSPAEENKKPLFDTSMFRPIVAFHEISPVVDAEFVTLTGVVFSRSPIDRVTVGERVAMIRPAEPKDLVKLQKVPPGASDAPFRTYFEVPDAGLPRLGANDLDVRALSADGRMSDLHRITIIKTVSRVAAQ